MTTKVRVYAKFDGTNEVEISDWVERVSITRGRSYEFDRIEPGVMTLTLNNEDGRFTPGLTPRLSGKNYCTTPTSRGKHIIGFSGVNYNVNNLTLNGRGFDFTTPTSAYSLVPAGGNAPITDANRKVTVSFIYGGSGTGSWRVRFYDASGVEVGPAYTEALPSNPGSDAGLTHFRINRTITAPVGATQFRLTELVYEDAAPGVARRHYFQDIMWTNLIDVDYFDGGMDDCSWDGTRFNSTSTQAARTPPYYPYVNPGVTIRAVKEVPVFAQDRNLFIGTVERWPMSVEPGVSTITVTVTDSLRALAQVKMPPPLAGLFKNAKPYVHIPCVEGYGVLTANNWGVRTAVTSVVSSGTGVGVLGSEPVTPQGDVGGRSFEVQNLGTGSNDGSCLRSTLPTPITFTATSAPQVTFMHRATSKTDRNGSTLNADSIVFQAITSAGGMALAVTVNPATNRWKVWHGPGDTTTATPQLATDSLNLTNAYSPGDVFYVLAKMTPTEVANQYGAGIHIAHWRLSTRTWSIHGPTNDTVTGYINTTANNWKFLELGNPLTSAHNRSGSLFTSSWSRGAFSHLFVTDNSVGAGPSSIHPDKVVEFSGNWTDTFLDTEYLSNCVAAAGLSIFWTDFPQKKVTPPNWPAGTNGYDEAQAICNSTLGILAASTDNPNLIVYTGYHTVRTNPLRLVLDCAGVSQPESGLVFEKDFEKTASEVTITGGYQAAITHTDVIPNSQVPAGEVKTYSVDSRLALRADIEALAGYYKANLGQAEVRCDRVTVDVHTVDDQTEADITRSQGLGQRMLLTNLPGAAPRRSLEYIIQGISWEVTAESGMQRQTVTYQLSPVKAYEYNIYAS